jgi:hypothetical protein
VAALFGQNFELGGDGIEGLGLVNHADGLPTLKRAPDGDLYREWLVRYAEWAPGEVRVAIGVRKSVVVRVKRRGGGSGGAESGRFICHVGGEA